MSDFDQVYQEAEKIRGFLFKEEARCLFELAGEIEMGGVIVELGSFYGKSSRILVDQALQKNGTLYMIDAFIPNFDGLPYEPFEAIESVTANILIPYSPHAKLIQEDTADASKHFHSRVDFLFIDADHSYEGIRRDCRAWLPKLRSGCVVAFHDFNDANWSDVSRGAKEFLEGWQLVRNDFSIAAFRKP